MPGLANVAQRLRTNASATPGKPAVVICRGPGEKGGKFRREQITFAELERDSDAAARGFEKIGIHRGLKTLVMLRPSFPFFSCFYALFKIGAVPVLIDPGMGGKRLLECLKDVQPEAMVGIPLAHAARVILPGYFPKLKISVTLGKRWFWRGHLWEKFRIFDDQPFPMAETRADDLAAILFTTGSTGPAKGVEYNHGALNAQVGLIADALGINQDDRDAATFPGFSLFSIALGMTAAVPDMNPTKPGSAFPPNIETVVNENKCTFSFGSPALWNRVSAHAHEHSIKLPTLKKVIMAGAPVPNIVHERLLGGILPEGAETYTPYGATECMPVSNMRGSEVLRETASLTKDGKGVCVGLPVPGLRAEIITITDTPIEKWNDGLLADPAEIGEIAIKADHASRHYHGKPEADRLAKISDGDKFWHRMGDVGYKDDKGRLWFCGRKSDRVVATDRTYFTIPAEAIVNQHPAVFRSALVGVGARGRERPVFIIELKKDATPTDEETLRKELLQLAAANPASSGITDILFHPAFPVDIRHNAKIGREALAKWAAEKF
jgi:Acyl-CoA synthetases (AMP-forming)/AMP-acid ligases II